MKTLPSELSKLPNGKNELKCCYIEEILLGNVKKFITFSSNYELTYYDCCNTRKLYTGIL